MKCVKKVLHQQFTRTRVSNNSMILEVHNWSLGRNYNKINFGSTKILCLHQNI